jgi:hypothetical protein
MKIRELKAKDRGNIYELLQNDNKFKPGEIEEVLHQIDLFLFDTDQHLFKVILAEDKLKELVGYAVYGPDPQSNGTYKIYSLNHSPLTDDEDVLLRLLLFIEKDLSRINGRRIVCELSSNYKYRTHVETYFKQNFDLSSVVSSFYSEGEDKLILSKYIGSTNKN